VEELSRADCWILGFRYFRNGSSNTGPVAESASPELKIWERRRTSDGIRYSRKDLPDLKNLKADVAKIQILLEADLTSTGNCSGSEVSGLDPDAGGRPGLEESGYERWDRLGLGRKKRMMGG